MATRNENVSNFSANHAGTTHKPPGCDGFTLATGSLAPGIHFDAGNW